MTAEEAALQRGDEHTRFETGPTRDKSVTARPTRTVVILVVVGWALASFGCVGLLWSLPGAGVFTRVSILGFPLHWAFVGIGSVAFFIALAVLYNLHVDARAEGAGALPESRRPEV